MWALGGRTRVAFAFTIAAGKVAEIDMVADPERLQRMHVVLLDT